MTPLVKTPTVEEELTASWYTPAELARYLGRPAKYVRAQIAAGLLDAHKDLGPNGHISIHRSAIIAWLEAKRIGAGVDEEVPVRREPRKSRPKGSLRVQRPRTRGRASAPLVTLGPRE